MHGFAWIALAALVQFSLPGVPGLGANVALKAASKAIAPSFIANEPIIRDWSAIYRTSDALPSDASFAPAGDPQRQATLERSALLQLHGSASGAVLLAQGDYALPVRLFCTDIHRHAASPEVYLLGPLRGKRAGVLTAMYANAAGTAIPFSTLQPLSWSLQEGLKYEELPVQQQNTFDGLLPGRRSTIATSFVELMQSQWATASSTIPGLPSFNDALAQMGYMGRTIQDAQYARDRIIANASDFDALRSALVSDGAGTSGDRGDTPWSVPEPNVYERLITQGAYGSTGLLEIHITGAGKTAAPITSNIAYAPNCHDCQPLTMHPLRDASPQPSLPAKIGVF